MDAQASRGVCGFFDDLDDPRVVGRCAHSLNDIVMIALVALLGDCDDWVEVEMFGQLHEAWFKRFLKLPNGIPSHDTFERVFARLCPKQMHRCFERWMSQLCQAVTGESKTITIDGKTLRSSASARGSSDDQVPLHLVSAWAQEAKLVLAQVPCAEKSNEITAIPQLIEMMELRGCTVTLDAMGCQRAIAEQLHEKKAGYVMTLKGNQETLHTQAMMLLAEADDAPERFNPATHRTDERARGRHEVRTYTTVKLGPRTSHRIARDYWSGLSAVGRVVSQRTVKGKTTIETRYHLLSDVDVERYAKAARGHWGIENSAHWVLDVAFGEDANRTSKDHGPENLAILRRLALNLFRANRKRSKIALKNQRKMVGWNIEFVDELLTHAI
ncbi:MAG TPA: ISAs1 family transposase [Anaerolineae bacterium]